MTTTLLPLLDREPVQIVAGDSLSFARTIPNCPSSDGWVVSYRMFGPLANGTGAAVNSTVSAVADGAGWTVTFAATVTVAVITDGTYRLVGRATNATTSEALTVYDAPIRILANPITATASSMLTHAEKMLTLIEAALEGRVPADMQSYAIDGKQITKIPVKELLAMRATYSAQVWKARNPGTSGPRRLVRF